MGHVHPPSVAPPSALQPAHDVVWQAIRHLFPSHAVAFQARGGLSITWPLEDDPTRRAVPVVLRLEDEYLQALREAGAPRRAQLAALADEAVRAGMRGYDPYARIPGSRVIVVG